MSNREVFMGRSISVVNDLSVDEQLYLYEKTRELKEELLSGGEGGRFRINDPEMGLYLMFLEDSTRTKESFRNAAKFHRIKVNDFDARSSSFAKKESITDTVKMLFGYSKRSMFVFRTNQEGVTRWLEQVIGQYAEKVGLPCPSFINGGDGKHEHPTQEFLDEFTFLEQKSWQRDHLRVALVGDLFHGRTIHSKADGLRVFKDVHVDLIAPRELALPEEYKEKMTRNGFQIREFPSIAAYLSQPEIADIWYFTRLQLERMGEEILEKADFLRESVTFSKEFLPKLPAGVKFYHPLPRNRVHPTLPTFLDTLPLNGWDMQSMNGYYTRIIEIGMLAGMLGDDFQGKHPLRKQYVDDFIKEAPINRDKKADYKIGIKPVENGIVIDHIEKGKDISLIWNHIVSIRKVLDLNCISSQGVFRSQKDGLTKGIISLPDILTFDKAQIKILGAIAPGCTVNFIQASRVKTKYRLHMPPRVYNFKEISCKNKKCVSHPLHHEGVIPEFLRAQEESTYVCKYCENSYNFYDIWDF